MGQEMRKRPDVLRGKTVKSKSGCGSCYITLNKDDEGNLFEIKLTLGKAGSCINTMLYREAILWSYICQLGATKDDILKLIKKHWMGISCDNSQKLEDGRMTSCGDVIGRAILEELQDEKEKKN
jgi:ribonucleoside-diphosphate reductase alpha chain